MKKYKSRNFSNKKAQTIGLYIERTFKVGQVTPHQLLESARPKSSEIHEFFEWNDKKAAERYRLWQARYYLGQLMINDEKGNEIKAFYNINLKEEETRNYYSFDKARANENLWDQIILGALKEVEQWQKKYQTYKELAPIHRAIEKTKHKLRK